MPPQDPRIEIVAHIAKNADRNDPQILHCVGQSIRRNLHQLQEKRPQYKPQSRKRNCRRIEKEYCCPEQFFQCGLIGCSAGLRNKDGNAGANAKKDTQKNFQRL